MKKAYTEMTLAVVKLQERAALLAASDNEGGSQGGGQQGPGNGSPSTFYGTFG